MIFKEFGDKNAPAIILLHGGGLSWWSWETQIGVLKNNYRVITPIIDGHGDAWDTVFAGIKKSAEPVINYIKEHYNGQVFALCGLSLGAQIVVEVLSKEPDIAEYAVIESAVVYPSKLTVALAVPMYRMFYGLIKNRWFSKLQAKSLNVPDALFDNYYHDSTRMTKESLINLTKSSGDYSMPASLGKTKAKALILVGEKELSIMKRSALLLHDAINHSLLKVIGQSGHGEISLLYPGKYLDLIRNFFEMEGRKTS